MGKTAYCCRMTGVDQMEVITVIMIYNGGGRGDGRSDTHHPRTNDSSSFNHTDSHPNAVLLLYTQTNSFVQSAHHIIIITMWQSSRTRTSLEITSLGIVPRKSFHVELGSVAM